MQLNNVCFDPITKIADAGFIKRFFSSTTIKQQQQTMYLQITIIK
jgi:hypothetical protein